MPQECLDRDDLRAMLQSVRGKGVAQPMTTRLAPRSLRIPFHLLLHRSDREGPVWTFLIPEDIRAHGVRGTEGQTGLETRHRIRGDRDPPIFPAFALDNLEGLLRPVTMLHLEVDHLGDPQATPEHEQEEGLIHGVVDLRTQPLHLVLREGFGQGPAPAYHVTRCNRVTYDAPLLNQRVKEMFQRMQAPMERRGGEPLVVLPVHNLFDVAKRDLGERLRTRGKEQLEIEGRAREGMGGVVAALERRSEAIDGLANRVVHGLSS